MTHECPAARPRAHRGRRRGGRPHPPRRVRGSTRPRGPRAGPRPRRRSAGVTAMVTTADDLASARWAAWAADSDPRVFAAVGLHPTRSNDLTDDARAAIEDLTAQPRVVAVGESGLDDYWTTRREDCAPLDVQREAFAWHIDLAKRTGPAAGDPRPRRPRRDPRRPRRRGRAADDGVPLLLRRRRARRALRARRAGTRRCRAPRPSGTPTPPSCDERRSGCPPSSCSSRPMPRS